MNVKVERFIQETKYKNFPYHDEKIKAFDLAYYPMD